MATTTKITGLWIDPVSKVTDRVKRSEPVSIRETVNQLTEDVLEKVNKTYSFEPPLDLDDTIVDRLSDAESDADLHQVRDADGLIILIKPKIAASKRIVQRTKVLKQTEEKACQLIQLLHGSDNTETDMDDLVHFFKDMRRDVQNLKAETTRLNRLLVLGEDSRKDMLKDMLNMKEESARLNGELLIAEDQRKNENKDLIVKVARLKAVINKEREERREERQVVVADLELQSAKVEECERELRKANVQHDNDLRDISELTQKLVPIHLRILLDYSRDKILRYLGCKTWVDFRKGRSASELKDVIVEKLRDLKVVDPLSQETVLFLCSFNNIRKLGDYFAHNATQPEIKKAVMTKMNSEEGLRLEELYQFVYTNNVAT